MTQASTGTKSNIDTGIQAEIRLRLFLSFYEKHWQINCVKANYVIETDSNLKFMRLTPFEPMCATSSKYEHGLATFNYSCFICTFDTHAGLVVLINQVISRFSFSQHQSYTKVRVKAPSRATVHVDDVSSQNNYDKYIT